MNFSNALMELKKGRRLRRDKWASKYIVSTNDTNTCILLFDEGVFFKSWKPEDDDLFADDWVIVLNR